MKTREAERTKSSKGDWKGPATRKLIIKNGERLKNALLSRLSKGEKKEKKKTGREKRRGVHGASRDAAQWMHQGRGKHQKSDICVNDGVEGNTNNKGTRGTPS